MDPNTMTDGECDESGDVDEVSHQSIDEDKLEVDLLQLPCTAGVVNSTESLQRKKGRLQRSARLKSESTAASYSSWEALVKESFGQMAWPIKIKSWELVNDRVQVVPNSTSATELISRRGVFSRRNYGSVDQIPQTDLDGIDPNCKRFRVENGESLAEKDEVFGSPSTPILENPEHQTRWYFKYFLGKLHQNYNGVDSDKNPYFLSVVTQDSGTQGALLYRAILFRKQGAQKIALSFGPNHKPSAKQILGHFSKADVSGKNPKELFSADIQKDLLLLEEQEGSVNFKFGVIYMKSGQTCDDEMLSNVNGSEAFNNFLEILGEKIRLKGWDNFRGGLDVKGDMTGKYSFYTLYEGHEIMFHVSTLLPFSRDNKQQVERKRHIGNDIVNIIYMEKGDSDDASSISPLTFDPNWIRSQFTHIFAVVTKEDKKFKLAIFCDENVPPFGPTLPNPPEFSDYSMLRQFLLVKLINAEKAAFQTPLFARKRERTLEMLIKDLHEEYTHDSKQNMLYRRAFSEVLYDAPRTSKLKEEARQVEFVRIGQALKLEAIVRGDAPTSLASASPCTVFKRPPWEPHCFYPALQHRGTLAGDSFGNECLFISTDDGTFLVQEDQSHHLVFDKTLQVKQLSVLEEHGLLLVRGGSANNRDGHRIHVFRLKEFQTPVMSYRTRIEVKDRRIDRTRGCHLYTTSKINGGHLKLAVAIGKKITIFQWKHSAAWASWCSESDNETADGFLFQREIQLNDVPTIITILEWANSPTTAGVLCVGFKHHFEIVSDINGTTNRLFEVESSKRTQTQLNAAIELCDGQEIELLLCYNHTCHFQKLNENTVSNEFDFHWNTSPISVVCAFPYILAFTSDSIEIRLLVNGNLVHTAIMPELKLISSKRDIFFVTTAPEFFSRDPMTKTPSQLLHDSSLPSTNSSEEDSDKVMMPKCPSDSSDKIPINPENDLNTLVVPQTKNDGIQRAKSLQKQRNAGDDNKRLISKSNSCGDSHMVSERDPPILEAPPNTPRAISRLNSPISPTKRNPKYRNPFINSEQFNSNSPERIKPLRIYRIPLANLTGTHSHFHMQTIASITRQPEIKRHHLPSDNQSDTDPLPDDYNSINSINEAIDNTTCNCGNLSIFTS